MLKDIFTFKNNSDGQSRTITFFGFKFTYIKGFWINYNWIKKFWWIFPTKETRNDFKKLCEKANAQRLVRKIPESYAKILKKLSKKSRLKVLFMVSENSKWKAQSLYDLMNKYDKFEPMIVLYLADYQERLTHEEKMQILNNNYIFFKNKNMNVIIAYDSQKRKSINIKKFNPDIIFYQQPWNISFMQSPQAQYKNSLLCYIPYHSPNYGGRYFDTDLLFFRYLFRYYVANEEYKKTFYSWSKLGNMMAVGHTMLDQFTQNSIRNDEAKEGYVIYAPHHSIYFEGNPNKQSIGTFLQNGEFILDYAKKHLEIKWVFKPHPYLKELLNTRAKWSIEKVEAYYKEWEKIAKCCYDSSYIELFFDSRAMITDCASFLTEYFCTKKPLIHLISKECQLTPISPFKKIIDTFYKVNNNEEFLETMDRVIFNNDDYKKTERLKALEESKLLSGSAAQNIINDLEETIWGK